MHAQFEIRFIGRFVSWFQRVDPVWLLLARYDWYSPCVVTCLPILMTNGIAYSFIENTDIANNKKHYPLPPPRWKGRNNRIIPSYQNKIDGMKKKARIHDIFTISAILQVLNYFEPIWLLWTTITSNTIPTSYVRIPSFYTKSSARKCQTPQLIIRYFLLKTGVVDESGV